MEQQSAKQRHQKNEEKLSAIVEKLKQLEQEARASIKSLPRRKWHVTEFKGTETKYRSVHHVAGSFASDCGWAWVLPCYNVSLLFRDLEAELKFTDPQADAWVLDELKKAGLNPDKHKRWQKEHKIFRGSVVVMNESREQHLALLNEQHALRQNQEAREIEAAAVKLYNLTGIDKRSNKQKTLKEVLQSEGFSLELDEDGFFVANGPYEIDPETRKRLLKKHRIKPKQLRSK